MNKTLLELDASHLELSEDALDNVIGGYYGLTYDPYAGQGNAAEAGVWTAWGTPGVVGGEGSVSEGASNGGASSGGASDGSMGDSCGACA